MNLLVSISATHVRSPIPCRDYNALFFFVLEPSAISPRRFEIFFKNGETPMSMQLPDTISLRNKDSAVGRFWARCAKVQFLSRTRLRIFLDHLWSHNALSKPRRQSGASEPQLESEALLNFFRIFFEFFLKFFRIFFRIFFEFFSIFLFRIFFWFFFDFLVIFWW